MKKVNILYLCLLFVYLATAAVALTFSFLPQETIFEKGKIVGSLLALSSIPHLLIFVLQDGKNNPKKAPYGGFGLAGIVLGITCMYLNLSEAMLNTICLIWGVFDLARSTYEIVDLLPEVLEKKWLEIIEICISVGEIVIAVLLIADRFEGIKLHFLYLGCSFILYFVKFVIAKILEKEE